MQHTFKILSPDIIPSETNLFAEVSNQGISFFFQEDNIKIITGLSVFNFEKKSAEDTCAAILTSIFDELDFVKENFNKIFISYAFNESILIPGKYYNLNQNDEQLNLLYGDVYPAIVLADHIAEKNLYNAYRIPADVHQVINQQFASAVFFHQYSLLIKNLIPAGNVLKLIFYTNKIIISLQKEEKLQIIQAFTYITAEDVVYHMLNVCRQFNAQNVSVQLCGMIEKDSSLFNEIQKYFLTITFPDLPHELSYSDEIKQYPSHFF